MAFARDAMRAHTIQKRREQRRRNLEAIEQEAARQAKLEPGYRPPAHGRKAMRGAPENKMMDAAGEDDKTAGVDLGPEVLEASRGPILSDLPWASTEAFGRATAHGLTYDDFEGHTPTGARGFRAADVAAVLKGKANR